MAASNETVVGFYFAQDRLIHRSADLASGKLSQTNKSQKAVPNGVGSIEKAAEILLTQYSDKQVVGVGLAVPTSIVELNHKSERYGALGTRLTPKRWVGFNAISQLRQSLSLQSSSLGAIEEISVISQVGATAKGHFEHHLALDREQNPSTYRLRENRNTLYVVADSGIGVAAYCSGWLIHGNRVPNIGHSLVVPIDDHAYKRCAIHPKRTCLNSFASLDAIYERWPEVADLDNGFEDCRDDSIVSTVAHYIAQAVSNLVLFISPDKIILGGRIANNPLFMGHFVVNLEALLHADSQFDDVSYDFTNNLARQVEHQGDKDFGVNGAIWSAREQVERKRKLGIVEAR